MNSEEACPEMEKKTHQQSQGAHSGFWEQADLRWLRPGNLFAEDDVIRSTHRHQIWKGSLLLAKITVSCLSMHHLEVIGTRPTALVLRDGSVEERPRAEG